MKRRIGLVMVLGLALSLAFLTVASAHAKLISSDPAAGAKLTSAPSKVTLVFSEEISAKENESFFKVTNASGASVGTGKPDANGHSEGSFTFGINAEPGAQPTAAPEPTEAPEATAAPGAAQPTPTPHD